MTLSPNTIKPAKGTRKAKRRIGRGNASGRGNFSGRGMKGQRSRSGGKGGLKKRGLKQLLQSTPKMHGFKSQRVKPVVLTLTRLDKTYQDGETVNLVNLKSNNLIGKLVQTVKVVATGEIKKKLTFEGVKYTAKAKELIEKAGGEIK